MKLKRLLTLFGACSLALACACACSDDDEVTYPDVDSAAPVLQMESEAIQTEPGRDIRVKGTVTDADGIASIELSCPGLYIEKTIDLLKLKDELLTEYELDYLVRIDKDEIGDLYTMDVTATDVGGRKTAVEVTISMDGDFADPQFSIVPSGSLTVLFLEGADKANITLDFKATDNRALDYILLSIPELSVSKTIEAGGQKEFSCSETVELPTDIKTYAATVTAYDKSGKSVSAEFEISVSELKDFEKIWLADVDSVDELNSDIMGVPMLCKHTGEFQYSADYYNAAAGTEICFLPQKASFSPVMFGADAADKTKLTFDNPEKIVLAEGNVYYHIEIDTKKGEYTLSTYPVSEAVDPFIFPYGDYGSSTGLDTWNNGGEWLQELYFGIASGPKDVHRFDRDETNPHIYRLREPLHYEAGEKLSFIIHNWHSDGWWNFLSWRVDNSDDPELWNWYSENPNYENPEWTGYKGKQAPDNWCKPTVPATGDYTFIFDTSTGWGRFIPAK